MSTANDNADAPEDDAPCDMRQWRNTEDRPMTDLSNVKARLHLLPLRTIIGMTWRLKLARFFLWLARVTDTYDGAAMSISRRIVESAERCALKSDDLRRRLRP